MWIYFTNAVQVLLVEQQYNLPVKFSSKISLTVELMVKFIG